MKHPLEHEDIDRVLSREETVLPSSGFAVSVMDAIRRECAAPAPIAFPWKWALPGVAVGGVSLVFVIVAIARIVSQTGNATTLQVPVFMPLRTPSLLGGGVESAVLWTVLSLIVALASVKFAMRLGSSLA